MVPGGISISVHMLSVHQAQWERSVGRLWDWRSHLRNFKSSSPSHSPASPVLMYIVCDLLQRSSGKVNSVVTDLHCVEWFCWQVLFVTGHSPEVPSKVSKACPCREGKWRSLPNVFLFTISKVHPSFSKFSDSSWETQEMSFIFENAMLVHVEAPKCYSERRQRIFMAGVCP